MKSQNATSSWGGKRKLPNAFTEQGGAMLSSVLNSDTAIEVNIRIIRVFTKMKEYVLTQNEILLQLPKKLGNMKKLLQMQSNTRHSKSYSHWPGIISAPIRGIIKNLFDFRIAF